MKFGSSALKMSSLVRIASAAVLGLFLGSSALSMTAETFTEPRPLSVRDVLGATAVDRVTPSPDGQWLAAVILRPANAGETFGRTSYEVDPSRSDVWLISTTSNERRNLTQGAASGAGYWCATWSPDGRHLLMLSTQSENAEPRGGDNVRLYLWNLDTDVIERVSDRGVVTQTRYGGPMYALDIRGGSATSSQAHSCRLFEENAPFAWLDNNRFIAAMVENGSQSGLLEQFNGPIQHSIATANTLRDGARPTRSISNSTSNNEPAPEIGTEIELVEFTVGNSRSRLIARLPFYPFKGLFSLRISEDGSNVAALVPTGVITPNASLELPYHLENWQVEKRLAIVSLADAGDVRWVNLPQAASFPLDLVDWSPGGSDLTFRARQTAVSNTVELFNVSLESLNVTSLTPGLAVGSAMSGPFPLEPSAIWLDQHSLAVRGRRESGDALRWHVIEFGEAPRLIDGAANANIRVLRTAPNIGIFGLAGGRAYRLDHDRSSFVEFSSETSDEGTRIVWPDYPRTESSEFVVSNATDLGVQYRLREVGPAGDAIRATGYSFDLPSSADILSADPARIVWQTRGVDGLRLSVSSFETGNTTTLLEFNEHFAEIDWGETRIVEYQTATGETLNAGVILPPNYNPNERYPTIVWVYPGHVVRGEDDYWLDRYLPGIYNLQLYAARGYVVLIPSMPFPPDSGAVDRFSDLSSGVVPAIDRLIALEIADPDRLILMGQSFGGYAVYSLIGQTNRFQAAIGISGITDLAQFYQQFDRTARGFTAIEHERSGNWSFMSVGFGQSGTPLDDPEAFAAASPMRYAGQIETPLLLIHGEFDQRADISHAEVLFSALYRQGREARLLRYWGENHSLALSPANVEDIVDQISIWIAEHLEGGVPEQ